MLLQNKTLKTSLSASQVLYRLAELEDHGAQFYEGVRNGANSEWVRKLATVLVRAEKRHHVRFLEYARMAEMGETGAGGIAALTPELSHLLNVQVFASRERAERSVQYASERDIVNVAIRAEESLALLMTELCDYVPRHEKTYIKRVIKEEWGHKASLEDLLRKHFK